MFSFQDQEDCPKADIDAYITIADKLDNAGIDASMSFLTFTEVKPSSSHTHVARSGPMGFSFYDAHVSLFFR